MSEQVIGQGIIEIVGDSRQLNAAIAEARRKLADFGKDSGKPSEQASKSIDKYIAKIQHQNAMYGRSSREVKLYELALKGATNEQLKAANAALRLADVHKRLDRLRAAAPAIGLGLAAGFIAATVAADRLIKKAGDYQDIAEKIGDTAQNVASLSVAAEIGGTNMDTVASAANRLTKNLTGVDDESKEAGAALKALGINIETFKQLKPSDQIEAVAKAMAGFEDGAAKSAVAMALFGRTGAEMMPFLKSLGEEGSRQIILTDEMIKKADEYSDKQAKLRGEIAAYAQVLAIQAMPAMNDMIGAFGDVMREMAGVGKTSNDLSQNTGIQDFADGAAQSIAFLIDTVDGAARFINILGKTIGAVVAAAEAVNRHQYGRAKTIMAALDDDIKAILGRVTVGEALRRRMEARNKNGGKPATPDTPPKPTLTYDGAVSPKKKGVNSAAKEAKEQLADDLAVIRKASQEALAAYSNAEKILEARRAASLVSDREYYEARVGFLRLDAEAQARALNAEIERLSQEKLVGEARVENDRKITEARAKLAQIQEDLAANTEVLGIQEAASIDKVAKAYADATAAAKEYIATIKRQNDREIAGVGRGERFRTEQSGRNDIEDKFTEQRQRLERDLRNGNIDTKQFQEYVNAARWAYNEEIRLFEERTARMRELQGNALNGITEALANYADSARDIAGQFESSVGGALSGLEDQLVGLVTTGKADFKSLANSIAADLTRIGIRSTIGSLAERVLPGMFGGGGAAGAVAEGAGAATQAAATAAQTAAITAQTTAAVAATTATTAQTTASVAVTTALTAETTAHVAATTSIAALTAAAAAAATALAAVAATSASKGAGDILGTIGSFAAGGGGRAIGGPVSARSLYEVNERGRPELLTVAGKQYLMTGAQGGRVDDVGGRGYGAGQTVNMNITVAMPKDGNRAAAQNFGVTTGRYIQKSLARNG